MNTTSVEEKAVAFALVAQWQLVLCDFAWCFARLSRVVPLIGPLELLCPTFIGGSTPVSGSLPPYSLPVRPRKPSHVIQMLTTTILL